MALSNLNALSVAMNAEQDSTVQALKLRLITQQLAVERARMSAEDVRGEERLREKTARTQVLLDLERARISAEDVSGEERLREATAQTHGAIRAVLGEIHAFRHGPHNGVSLDEIICNGFFAVARGVHR